MVVSFNEIRERLVKMLRVDQWAGLFFSRDPSVTSGVVQGETSRVMKIRPFIASRPGEDSLNPSGNRETGVKRLVETQPSRKPSLWNKSTFDIVAFTDRFYSIPRNFLNDYQILCALFPDHLSTLWGLTGEVLFIGKNTEWETRRDPRRISLGCPMWTSILEKADWR